MHERGIGEERGELVTVRRGFERVACDGERDELRRHADVESPGDLTQCKAVRSGERTYAIGAAHQVRAPIESDANVMPLARANGFSVYSH